VSIRVQVIQCRVLEVVGGEAALLSRKSELVERAPSAASKQASNAGLSILCLIDFGDLHSNILKQ
jgi:hypothetical protein